MEILLGGLITLAVTFVTQVFVVPRVQASSRLLQRWEEDVRGLRTLLEDELPEAIRELRRTGESLLFLLELRKTEDVNLERWEEMFREDKEAYRNAYSTCRDLITRLSRLEGRLSLLNRKAEFWRQLFWHRAHLQLAMYSPEIYPLYRQEKPSRDEADWKAALTLLEKRHRDLTTAARRLVETMRPPPTYPIRRVRKQLVRRGKEALARLKRQQQKADLLEGASQSGPRHSDNSKQTEEKLEN